MYGPSDLAFLNASGLPARGDLSIDGVPVNYSGSSLNVSLLPGPYRLDLQTTSRIGPGEVHRRARGDTSRPMGFGQPSRYPRAERSPSTLVTASGQPFPTGETVYVRWFPGGATVCAAQIPTNGSLSCQFDTPIIQSDWYGIVALNGSSNSPTGFGSFFVRSNLTEMVDASPSSNDALETFNFTAQRSGGIAPFSDYLWNFGDGTGASTTMSTVAHSFNSGGSYSAASR